VTSKALGFFKRRSKNSCSVKDQEPLPPELPPAGNRLKKIFPWVYKSLGEGAVASRLVHSPPDQVVCVRALADDIVLCCWARCLPANLVLGVTYPELFCATGTGDKHWPDESPGSMAQWFLYPTPDSGLGAGLHCGLCSGEGTPWKPWLLCEVECKTYLT